MELFEDLIKYGTTWIHLLKNHLKVFKLEAKLAQLSFFRFCIALVIISNLLLTTWLSIIFILSYEIFFHTSSLLITGLFVFIVNLILLCTIIIYAMNQIKNMQFQTSRKAMLLLARKRINHADKPFEKTNSSTQ